MLFHEFPDDVIKVIFSFCSPEDRKNLSLTCKKFKDLRATFESKGMQLEAIIAQQKIAERSLQTKERALKATSTIARGAFDTMGMPIIPTDPIERKVYKYIIYFSVFLVLTAVYFYQESRIAKNAAIAMGIYGVILLLLKACGNCGAMVDRHAHTALASIDSERNARQSERDTIAALAEQEAQTNQEIYGGPAKPSQS